LVLNKSVFVCFCEHTLNSQRKGIKPYMRIRVSKQLDMLSQAMNGLNYTKEFLG